MATMIQEVEHAKKAIAQGAGAAAIIRWEFSVPSTSAIFADVNAPNEHGMAAIHFVCASTGPLEMLQLLIHNKADVNVPDKVCSVSSQH